MSRQKKSLTRKQRALRTCAKVVFLLLLTAALQLYSFLPIQAVWAMSDAQDIEAPKVIHTFYDDSLPITRFALHHIVQGEDAMMFCTTGWNLMIGWYDRTWAVVETWNDTGLYTGIHGHSQDGKRVVYFYGRVDADAVERLTLDVEWTKWEQDREVQRTAQYTLTPEDFFERDGKLYFCAPVDMEVDWEWRAAPVVTCVTGDGTVLMTTEVDWRTWST